MKVKTKIARVRQKNGESTPRKRERRDVEHEKRDTERKRVRN